MRIIPLTRGKFAIVDNDKYDWLNVWKWCFDGKYAVRSVQFGSGRKNRKVRKIRMHRQILGLKHKDGRYSDHINHKTVDNRIANLRICSSRQNCQNSKGKKNCSSRYKGVSWLKRDKKWRAYIVVNYKQIGLGYFNDEKKAAGAYDEAAKELFREYAYTNF